MTKTFSWKSDRDGSWLRTYAFGMAAVTFGLMALGSATRVMNAGLSCPDWPLCYGAVVPVEQMNLQVFLEWFHRLVASSVGLLTLGFAAASVSYRQALPRWVPWAGLGAVLLVIWQGILGGLTVTQLLRFDIVTAHLGTGMLFFATWITIGTLMGNSTATAQKFEAAKRLATIGGIATVLVFGQSILGALVASQWALHQCLSSDSLCRVMNLHLYGVVPASLACLGVVEMTWRTAAVPTLVQILAKTIGGLLLLQVGLGVATYRLDLSVQVLTVLHQSVAAALFGTLFAFTLYTLGGHLPQENLCKN